MSAHPQPPPRRREGGKFARTYFPNSQIDEQIRDLYARFRNRGALRRLKAMTGWTDSALRRRIDELGLSLPFARHLSPWTSKELNFLETVGSNESFQVIQRRLKKQLGCHRTISAIQAKMCRMRLTRTWGRVNAWNQTELAALLGINRITLRKLTESGQIKATRHLMNEENGTRPDTPFLYRAADVRTFLIEHIEALDLARVDKYWLVELLTKRLGGRRCAP
jgi:hypothetical protein